MEGRMTVCNMTIEAGARAGMIAPDKKTYAYFEGRPRAPKGADLGQGRRAYWDTLQTDEGAHFDAKIVRLDAANLPPIVSLGALRPKTLFR
jgi:3-isopropylmalate/(R)-2-methylmalate dehydratase large subunit